MHAVVDQVKVDPVRVDEARKLLDEFVLPSAKASAGFQGGYWAGALEGDAGHSFLLCDTEENARGAVAAISDGPPPGAPVSFVSVTICEVLARA
jgi:hypothetical protein